MKMLSRILSRFRILGDLFTFFLRRGLWWLTPMLVILLAFGVLMIFAQATPLGPFIYALF